MSDKNLITGSTGLALLPSGLELNLLKFSMVRVDREEDTTAVGEEQENGGFTTWRLHGTGTGQVKAGSPTLGQRYEDVDAIFIVDATPTSPDGQINGTWNFDNIQVVTESKKFTTISFSIKSQNVAFGPIS